MSYYKTFDGKVLFKEINKILMENAASYQIKIDQGVAFKRLFKHDEDVYITLPIHFFLGDKLIEIDKTEYESLLKERTKEIWNNLSKEQANNSNNVFTLRDEEILSRYSYCKVFNVDNEEFGNLFFRGC